MPVKKFCWDAIQIEIGWWEPIVCEQQKESTKAKIREVSECTPHRLACILSAYTGALCSCVIKSKTLSFKMRYPLISNDFIDRPKWILHRKINEILIGHYCIEVYIIIIMTILKGLYRWYA